VDADLKREGGKTKKKKTELGVLLNHDSCPLRQRRPPPPPPPPTLLRQPSLPPFLSTCFENKKEKKTTDSPSLSQHVSE
jgi:hypothetical protein